MSHEQCLHARIYCPSCGNEVVLGAHDASVELDLTAIRLRGSFVAAHTCSPPEPTAIVEIKGDVDEETAKRVREMLLGFRGRKG